MAWYIDAATFDEWMLSWGDMLTVEEKKALPEDYIKIGSKHGEPFHPDLPVIRYVQNGTHTKVPAICPGRFSSNLLVNTEVRSLIEEMEPDTHFFHPVELHMTSGDILIGTHFIMRLGELVDGVIEESSDVCFEFKDGVQRQHGSLKGQPKITWRSEVVAGRHIWMDQYFKPRFFCSDELMNELKKRELGYFNRRASFIE